MGNKQREGDYVRVFVCVCVCGGERFFFVFYCFSFVSFLSLLDWETVGIKLE